MALKKKDYVQIERDMAQKSGKVTVTYDPNVIKKSHKSKAEIENERKHNKQDPKDLIGSNVQTKFAMESMLGKDERKFRLKNAWENGKVVTLESAAKLVGVTKGTARKYCHELNISVLDAKAKKWLPGKQLDLSKVK